MFDKLRRPGRSIKEGRTKKLFSYFIFGIICLIFVFLVPVSQKIIGEGVVAYVGNEPIRARELRFLEDSIKRQYQSRLDQADDENLVKIQEEIRQIAKREIIKKYLLVQGSQKSGFFVSDKELRSEIRSLPVFQENGRFLYSRYLSFLKSQRLQPSRFEDGVRKDKLVQNWIKLFEKAVVLNNLEKEKKSQRHSYKVNLRYAEILSADVKEEKLEPFIHSRDLKNINSFLKKHDITWNETGDFSTILGSSHPISQNQSIMEIVIHHLPQMGIIPRLIRQDDKIYIVDILSFKEKSMSQQDQRIEDFLTRRFDKSSRLLESWMDFQRQKTKVRLSGNI